MAFWAIAALIFGGALMAGLAMPRRPTAKRPVAPPLRDEEEFWTPDAVARLGTPETVADLIAQGRGDELRGLGYSGELPED
jgi:hypothetical protein